MAKLLLLEVEYHDSHVRNVLTCGMFLHEKDRKKFKIENGSCKAKPHSSNTKPVISKISGWSFSVATSVEIAYVPAKYTD